MSEALRLYDDHPLGIRVFVRARHLLSPMRAIERRVPADGRILDLGCGHGLFTALMATASPGRSVVGVDPSAAKIAVAHRLEGKLPGVRFLQGTIDDVDEEGLRAITILDVLYLLPVPEKLRILSRCREMLAPGGQLILKTNDTHPAWKYRWAWFQEAAMTRLGLTLSTGSLHFISCRQTVELLRQTGFRDVQVDHLSFLLPYPHTLFTCSP
jgi:2-polyprenyl-3-methyl-5-hydroxy-6-metoxy-1,4-benzoquinol methylase